MTLQALASQEKARGGDVSAQDLVHHSRLYRSTLHECVLGLRSPDQGNQWSCDLVTPPTCS